MEFIVLQSFASYIDAHILMGRLEEEGIKCWLKDENTVTIDPILTNAVGGIKVMVLKEQAERAMELLKKFTLERKKQLACPNCGSHDIELITTSRKPGNWFSTLFGFLFTNYALPIDQVWHCFKCESEFKEPVEMSNE